MSKVSIVRADLARADHQRAVVDLTQAYALDEMGNGGPLPDAVLDDLIGQLQAHPTTMIFLAFVDGQPAGIATCFRGFSTFAARPLINIHDLAVLPEYRGHGIGQALINAVEVEALAIGCVKLTLEVYEGNIRAKGVYEKAGFSNAVLGKSGGTLFYSKRLNCGN